MCEAARTAPPEARCCSRQSPSSFHPAESSAFEGSSRSHKGRRYAATRASAARFRLASREQPHRHVASSEALAPTGPGDGAAPESQRLASGKLAIEREGVVGKGDGPLRSSRVPAASSPAARRIRLDLPLPFGPVTCSASPGPSSRSRSSNNSRPPRRQVTPSNRSSGCHSRRCASSACMSSSE
jgi:hypothetical protein